jgi:prolyl-tRNA synthetase
MGPRDLENNTVEVARRDTLTKEFISFDEVEERTVALMEIIQKSLFEKARDFRAEKTTRVDTWEDFQDVIKNKGGFVLAHWDGSAETEERIKQKTKATIRCIPQDSVEEEGKCIFTGNPSNRRVLFAKAY